MEVVCILPDVLLSRHYMSTLTVKYIRNFNGAPVVSYFDEQGMRQGLIISKEAVNGHRIGDMLEVSFDEIESGTHYGIDLETLTQGDFIIPASSVQDIMRSHDIWTEDDYQTKRQEVHAAALRLASTIVHAVDSVLNQLE